jgi:hypothetical protein
MMVMMMMIMTKMLMVVMMNDYHLVGFNSIFFTGLGFGG